MSCIDPETARELAHGRLAGSAERRHAAECEHCAAMVAELTSGLGEADTVAVSAPPDMGLDTDMHTQSMGGAVGRRARFRPQQELHIEPGTRVGRFVVAEPIGAGGMGIVYLARDDQLKRKVAIKLIRDGEGRTDQELAERLLREAQAVAALSHPNVVAVYDVGHHEGDPYVAMEYIDGATVREWLEEPREWPAILEVFTQAGRGLAAAHRAGIVHRDFKPDNVMVGSDRVRVMDFGLARSVERREDVPRRRISEELAAIDVDSQSLTRTGAVLGTPRYMAPEQREGTETDARTDQYSYCLALYEALGGVMPEPGKGDDEHFDRFWPERAPVWLRSPVLRGLRRDPQARFLDMDALLHELTSDPAARRRNMGMVLASGAVVFAALALVLWPKSPARPRCSGGVDRVNAVWSAEQRRASTTAFARSGRPYADVAARDAFARLDRFARSWSATHRDICEATHVRGEQSSALLDQRMRCLDRRLQQLDGVVRMFARADPLIVDRAGSATAVLSDPASCAEGTEVVLPASSASRTRVLEVRAALDRLQAPLAAGKLREVIPELTDRAEQARGIGFKPLTAEALYTLGRALLADQKPAAAQGPLQEAAQLAADTRNDELAARVWVSLIGAHTKQQRFEKAIGLEPVAQAWISRARASDQVRASLHDALGNALHSAGRYREAIKQHRESLAIVVKKLPVDHPARRRSLNNLGLSLYRAADYDGARAQFLRKLELEAQYVPSEHLSVSHTHENLGLVLLAQGEVADAETHQRRALAIRIKVLGEKHALVANAYNNLANAIAARSQFAEAERLYQKSLAIRVATQGEQHPRVARVLGNLSSMAQAQKKLDQAIDYGTRALRLAEARLGRDHPAVAAALHNLVAVYGSKGDCAKSLELVARVIDIRSRKLGADHPSLAWALHDRGLCELATKKLSAATATFSRALAIRTKKRVDPQLIADTQFGLARALWAQPAARKRSLALARSARATFASAGPAGARYRSEVERWLAKPYAGK